MFGITVHSDWLQAVARTQPCCLWKYSYLQNIRPLAATLHSAFLFTCGVVQIELIQIQSVTMSQLDKPYLTS